MSEDVENSFNNYIYKNSDKMLKYGLRLKKSINSIDDI